MRKLTFNEWLVVAIAIVIVSYFFFFNGTIFSFSNSSASLAGVDGSFQMNERPTSTSTNAFMAQTQTLPGIQITDTVVGNGEEATVGKTVIVNYTGMFSDGKIFDSSIPRGEPFAFSLGAGRVIKGWDEGVAGMKVGGKRTLVIAPEKGYGSQDVTNPYTGEVVIPANSTLIFEVELLDVQ